jgi:two-component sensor histidine kinase
LITYQIHQKLYQSEEIKTIDMAVYIPELVGYLKESFDTDKSVRYLFDIDPAKFDVGEAVPLGLLVNEIVTNSLKYAFPDGQTGTININFKATCPNRYDLNIADDDIGLPVGFDITKSNSMGMKLIKGLAAQLDGELGIFSYDGTQILVSSISTLSLPGHSSLVIDSSSSYDNVPDNISSKAIVV